MSAVAGCTDIDECKDPDLNDCTSEQACINYFYREGKGFTCVEKDVVAHAAVVSGLPHTQLVDVLRWTVSHVRSRSLYIGH